MRSFHLDGSSNTLCEASADLLTTSKASRMDSVSRPKGKDLARERATFSLTLKRSPIARPPSLSRLTVILYTNCLH